MVYRQINKGKTVRRRMGKTIFSILFLITVLIISGGALGYYIGESKNSQLQNDEVVNETSKSAEEGASSENEILDIDFQPVVDDWAKNVGGNKSVIIYDLDKDKISASINAEFTYDTASLYKLFVVYEGYRRVDDGEWQADEYIPSAKHFVIECLDLAIRESNSACAEAIWSKIGHETLDQIVADEYDANDTDLSKLTSTPEDILKIMKMYYYHSEIEDKKLVERLMDSFLNQPITEYDWRQGLPSGFTKAKVYNKVGWEYNPDKKYWNIYHDAAIVEFPEQNRHFIVIVMSNYVPFSKITALGVKIEDAFLNMY